VSVVQSTDPCVKQSECQLLDRLNSRSALELQLQNTQHLRRLREFFAGLRPALRCCTQTTLHEALVTRLVASVHHSVIDIDIEEGGHGAGGWVRSRKELPDSNRASSNRMRCRSSTMQHATRNCCRLIPQSDAVRKVVCANRKRPGVLLDSGPLSLRKNSQRFCGLASVATRRAVQYQSLSRYQILSLAIRFSLSTSHSRSNSQSRV
jgi:hypothetical protein